MMNCHRWSAATVVALALISSGDLISAQSPTESYRVPSKAIADALDAPPPPDVYVSPRGDVVALVETPAMATIGELARPVLRLAGIRIDPARNGRQRLRTANKLWLRRTNDGSIRLVTLPVRPALEWIGFSPSGAHFAFTQSNDDGIQLWIGDSSTGRAAPRGASNLNAVFKTPCVWVANGLSLLCGTTPSGRGRPPTFSSTPRGPQVRESRGRMASVQTFQDLLSSDADDALFDYYATVQWVTVDAETGARRRVGRPGVHALAQASPDGRFLLVVTLQRPYSHLVPFFGFSMDWEIWDASGALITKIARIPHSEGVRTDGVTEGPRNLHWKPSEPATLVWTEALDGGNQAVTVAHRDRVMQLTEPFETSQEIARTVARCVDVEWTQVGTGLITEFDRPSQRTKTWIVPRDGSGLRLVVQRSANDHYGDPGSPLKSTGRSDVPVVVQHGDEIYLAGAGASPTGAKPFLDSLNVRTLAKRRLYQNEREFESIVAVLPQDSSRVISRVETPVRPAEIVVRRTTGPREILVRLTSAPTAQQFATKQIVTYKRKDGVELSGTLYTPVGWAPEKGRLPLVLWAYPREVVDRSTAGQVTGAPLRYTSVTGPSQLLLVLGGCAVLDDVSMPVLGPAATANDSFVEQLVANAEAAIDHVVSMGVADRGRVAVGGHSYGAFMAVNLLAHSRLFRAGIARSGAYNRTLTPFGFQNETRTLWEARDVYERMSPFNYADQIKAPLLLIHGDADNNSGTFPIQSERLFLALQGNGAIVRLVLLPFESHAYVARESVMHSIAEMTDWLNEWLKPTVGTMERR